VATQTTEPPAAEATGKDCDLGVDAQLSHVWTGCVQRVRKVHDNVATSTIGRAWSSCNASCRQLAFHGSVVPA
jgi:hypothetical protein